MVPGYGDADSVLPFWGPADTEIAVVLEYSVPEVDGVQPLCALKCPADDRSATAGNATATAAALTSRELKRTNVLHGVH
jgi:hypothetical protein